MSCALPRVFYLVLFLVLIAGNVSVYTSNGEGIK